MAIPGTIPFTAHIRVDGPFTDGWLLLGHMFITALYIAWSVTAPYARLHHF